MDESFDDRGRFFKGFFLFLGLGGPLLGGVDFLCGGVLCDGTGLLKFVYLFFRFRRRFWFITGMFTSLFH